MIANARMYAVSRQAADLWRALLGALIERAGLAIALIEHAEPQPIAALWARTDQAAVFMCGLPFSRAEPRPFLMAAPMPSPAEFGGEARYWSNLVVRADTPWHTTEDTFGRRIAFTTPDSQSGYAAALSHFMRVGDRRPLFSEIIAPQITPLGAVAAVLAGTADVAPIDSYAYCLLTQYRPELTSRLRVVGKTEAMPIPPLVASAAVASHGELRTLERAFQDADRHADTRSLMEQLSLHRFVQPAAASYDVLRRDFEAARRYWRERPLAALIHPAFAP
jgi:ABC-type phosphate/phosphonate transport system substrate-binding protein